MSEFLMVVPQGWIEAANPEGMYSEESWKQFLPSDVAGALVEHGVLQEGQVVEDFRTFRDGEVLRLWVRLA